MSEEIVWTSGTELVDRMKSGDLTSVEVTTAFLERTQSLEPTLKSFITVDAEGAMDAAREADRRREAGEALGPLHGLPVGAKDNLWAVGMPTTGGSAVYKDFVSECDGLPVGRLRAAGAVLLGKNHMPEFAAWPRTTGLVQGENRNPWDTTRITGASSGGSGSAVAAAEVPMALGSDGGGSTRLPAALNGVVGVQPSRGIVPAWGQVGYGAYGAVGPMTRTVADAARTLTVISGPDSRDPMSEGTTHVDYEIGLDDGVKGMRFAWLDGMGDVPAVPSINAELRKSVDALAGEGAGIDERGERFDGLGEHFFHLNVGRHPFDGGHVPATQEEPFLAVWNDPEQRERLVAPYTRMAQEHAGPPNREAWERGKKWLEEAGARLDALFQTYDAILCPTAPFIAPAIPDDPWSMPFEDMGGYIANTGLVNLLRICGVSVPGGMVDGMPVGLQIITPQAGEAAALRIARAVELARPWAHLRPALEVAV